LDWRWFPIWSLGTSEIYICYDAVFIEADTNRESRLQDLILSNITHHTVSPSLFGLIQCLVCEL